MIRIAHLIFILLAGSLHLNAKNVDSLSLQVSWQPIENNYLGKEQALSVLEIKNTGKLALPASGWKLYFNFVRILQPKVEQPIFDMQHVNGDYFYFSPNANFKGLSAGETTRYELISNSWLVNLNDSPQGFYIVWDDGSVTSLPKVVIKAPLDAKKFYRVGGDAEMSAEAIYAHNEAYATANNRDIKPIFPSPANYEAQQGNFRINKQTAIAFDDFFKQEAGMLQDELSSYLGNRLTVKPTKAQAKNSITFRKEVGLGKEAYRMVISKTGIQIGASSRAGAFYAIQSLKTMLDPNLRSDVTVQEIQLPCVNILDEPRFERRAFMLDVARNFQSKAQVKKMLDIMALYKLNTLHFHLNDDEGWRLEIPALPELTAVGSQRGHLWDKGKSNLGPSYGSGAFTGEHPSSGFYTKEDFMEILNYATARHIQVIPEIETPGHARAAIKAMQARHDHYMAAGNPLEARKYLLRDTSDLSVYRSVQKWNDNVMDVSMPSVYNFLELVTQEIVATYKEAGAPLESIHFGGDEVPQGVWEKSPSVHKFMQENPTIKGNNDLWDYFFDKVHHILAKHNLYVSGWEEVGLHKLTASDGKKYWEPNAKFKGRNIHLNVWNNLLGNEDLAYRLANAGYKVVLSFVNNFYMDMSYYKRFDEPGFYWGGFISLDKPFSFIPYDYLKNQQKNYLGRQLSPKVLKESVKLTAEGRKNIVGLQALLWSETIKSPEAMEYMIFPRVLAFAEKAWAKEAAWEVELDSTQAASMYKESLSDFYSILGARELKRLNHYHGGVNFRIPSPGLKLLAGKVHANMELPGFTIRYSYDGSLPTVNSPVYNSAIPMQENLVFSAFDDLGRSSLPSYINLN